MNYLYNSVLLVRGHFVIGGEAETSAEEVGADVDARSFNVYICAAVALLGDEGVSAVDGLHVHGLPDGLLTLLVFGYLFFPQFRVFFYACPAVKAQEFRYQAKKVKFNQRITGSH